jgi:hypothetical protein
MSITLARSGRQFGVARSRVEASTLVLVHLPVGDSTNHYTYRLDVHPAPLMKYAGR